MIAEMTIKNDVREKWMDGTTSRRELRLWNEMPILDNMKSGLHDEIKQHSHVRTAYVSTDLKTIQTRGKWERQEPGSLPSLSFCTQIGRLSSSHQSMCGRQTSTHSRQQTVQTLLSFLLTLTAVMMVGLVWAAIDNLQLWTWQFAWFVCDERVDWLHRSICGRRVSMIYGTVCSNRVL